MAKFLLYFIGGWLLGQYGVRRMVAGLNISGQLSIWLLVPTGSDEDFSKANWLLFAIKAHELLSRCTLNFPSILIRSWFLRCSCRWCDEYWLLDTLLEFIACRRYGNTGICNNAAALGATFFGISYRLCRSLTFSLAKAWKNFVFDFIDGFDCGIGGEDEYDVDGTINWNRSDEWVIGCLTFRLKSLPNRSETISFDVDVCFCCCTAPLALVIFVLALPLLLLLFDDFHLEPSILKDARTDLLRRSIGDGVESDKRRYEAECSFSLFINITFVGYTYTLAK